MQDDNELTEGALRLRAVVRVFMSPAIWLLLGVQAAMLVLMQMSTGDGEAGSRAWWQPLSVFVTFFIFLYLLCGLLRTFAVERGVGLVPAVLANARLAFNDFIWLGLKAVLLFFLLMNLVLIALGWQPDAMMESSMRPLAVVTAALTLVLVYWLPVVFGTNNFRLVATLGMALRLAWRRLPHIGFPLLLLLGPAAVAILLPAETPFLVEFFLSLAGELLEWVVYVYCVEYVVGHRAAVAALSKDAGPT